jgi:inhibitor of KinA sporulation pathway (predicted exonuclease)
MVNCKRLDKIIIVDTEATCWEDSPPDGEVSEIIQIGICSLSIASGSISQKTSYIIKPRFSKISEYCTALTGISQSTVKGGLFFNDVCNKIIKDFGTKGRAWASYGIGDKYIFENECYKRAAKYPFSDHHIDVNLLFHLHNKHFEGYISLDKAMWSYGMDFIGKQHSADDDAYNTARLLECLLM